MNIYLNSGYLDIEKILSLRMPFTFIVGGRGIGKTFGALQYVINERAKFILLRRTQSQTDLINKPEFSPLKPVDPEIRTKPLSKYNAAIIKDDEILGYTAALSTISNMRGFDASDVDYLIYDEFIPEKHERPLKHEATAFLNAYETINRNRELQHRPPVQVLALANAMDLANPIFLELGIVTNIEKMLDKGRSNIYLDKERGLLVVICSGSPISKRKSETALYKLTKKNEFAKMALENEFAFEEIGIIKPQPLKEYIRLVTIGEITIYKHKSDRRYYVSEHESGGGSSFGAGDTEILRFQKKYYYLWTAYLDYKIIFENYLCQVLFEKYFC